MRGTFFFLLGTLFSLPRAPFVKQSVLDESKFGRVDSVRFFSFLSLFFKVTNWAVRSEISRKLVLILRLAKELLARYRSAVTLSVVKVGSLLPQCGKLIALTASFEYTKVVTL